MSDVTQPRPELVELWKEGMKADMAAMEARGRVADAIEKTLIDRGDLMVGEPTMIHFHPPAAAKSLRLWLPGLHTVSQNRTKGRGWIVSYKARKVEALALHEALPTGSVWPGLPMLREGRRVLALIAAGKDVRQIVLPAFTRAAGSPKLVITYTRVTTKPLDAENWCGSTKGMTDCLKYAFPGLLPDDAPEYVEILHKQERCRTRDEEGTWIELRLDQEGRMTKTE